MKSKVSMLVIHVEYSIGDPWARLKVDGGDF